MQTFHITPKLFLLILVSLFYSNRTLGQELEFDLSSGKHLSKISFSPTVIYNIAQSFEHLGSNFSFGLTKQIKNKFYFRTELGFNFTESLFSIEYEGHQNYTINRLYNKTSNQSIHLGVFPEFRTPINKSKIVFFYLKAGILFLSSLHQTSGPVQILQNDFDTVTTTTITFPIAFLIGTGFTIKVKGIGLKGGISYSQYGPSQIYSIYDPKIRYKNINTNFGICYYLNTKKNENPD